jgi:hypothetical protein
MLKDSQVRNTYAPWRANYLKSFVLFAIGFVVAFAVWTNYLPWPAVFLSVIPFLLAIHQIKLAKARKFGKAFEAVAINSAISLLRQQGFNVRPSVVIPGLGDVDMIVTANLGMKVTVEIKSFIRWNQFWIFRGAREAKALVQAERQKNATQADAAFIWLPQGRRSLLQALFGLVGNKHVRVVYGDASRLRAALKKV